MAKQKNSPVVQSRNGALSSSACVPQLRFPGFEGEWEMKKMGEVFGFKVTNSFSRENLNYEQGKVKNIHYGDIHTKFQTLFDITREYVPFINEDIPLNRISEDNFCQEGDLILADASEDLNDVGKSIEVFNLNNEKLLAGLHTILARPNLEKFEIGFVGYLFKSNKVRTKIQKEAQGSKVLSISATRLASLTLDFPSKNEQNKIANCFTAIDEKIQALKKKKSLLEQYKRGVMQGIFNYESGNDKLRLRFKPEPNEASGNEKGGSYPEWEAKNLGDVLFEHLDKNKNGVIIEVFSVSKHKGVVNQIEHLGRSFSAKETLHYKLIYPHDIVYTKSPTSEFPFGIIKQNMTGRIGVVSPLYGVFKPSSSALGFILHNYFNSWINVYNYLSPLVQKGAKNTMNINNEDFLNGAKLKLPISEKEQTKIANFLSSIDDSIANVALQIEKLEAWKKGLLQKMFV